MHTYCRQLQQLEEQKQQLEHYNATIQEEKDSLLQQNTSLTERLEAVVTEKRPCHQFDGQTPIDKTLDLLQNLILVGSQLKALAVHSSLSMTCQLTHLLHAYNYTRACVCVCVWHAPKLWLLWALSCSSKVRMASCNLLVVMQRH